MFGSSDLPEIEKNPIKNLNLQNKNMNYKKLVEINKIMQDIQDVQKYTENKYPPFFRKDVIKIDISNQNLSGYLDLREFPKLEVLNCANNQLLTHLDLRNCNNLK